VTSFAVIYYALEENHDCCLGYFQCEQCNTEGPWHLLRTVIDEVKDKKKPLTDQQLEQLNFRKAPSKAAESVSWDTMQSLHQLPPDEVSDLLGKFNLPVSFFSLTKYHPSPELLFFLFFFCNYCSESALKL